ncbi:BnaA05g35450D [Brassica napus]|uniref:BnaA05g35450D protein n=1 Tax=Brassica napus TaxID=3708 RepID=A0A078J1M9_BRANA|nr:BnaA05g35450D [Brassica napus]
MSLTAIGSGEEPPSKKLAIEPTTNLPLPDELVLGCFARASRLHYPILSLVSKTFRSLTSSPELYQTRSLLNRTENCLYVCLQFPNDPCLRWFTLCRKPDKALNNKKKKKKSSTSGNVLGQVRILAVGHKLYAVRDGPCSSDSPDSLNFVQVFDVKTQTWKPVPPEKKIFRLRDLQGRAYQNNDVAAASSRRWLVVARLKDRTVSVEGSGTLCLIEKAFYRYASSSGELLWSNRSTESDVWRKVKGLEGLPKFTRYSNVYLVASGGKLVVFWDKYVPARGGYKEKMIWCAEISLETRSSEEVWGKVEWFDAVLTVPKSYKFVYSIAATL